jgi:ActR/RegA family two-component response regulator
MSLAKILFVDDEANIRITLPKILELQGFEVEAAATVSEGLKLIQSTRYDILLTDLNIGEPGDGFTLVSAMRRVQPSAATLIITGFPAFETALRAIREQVDDYVVKPAVIPELVETLKRNIQQPRRCSSTVRRRISVVLQENLDKLLDGWLNMAKKNSHLAEFQLNDREWLNHFPIVLPMVFSHLDVYVQELPVAVLEAARRHGETRAEQGFNVHDVQIEARLLRQAIYHLLQQHLLAVDISYWIKDMRNLNDALDSIVIESVKALSLDMSSQAAVS